MRKTHWGIRALFVTATVSVWAGTASANLTTVHAPAAGEQSQAQILSHVYGGMFGPAGFSEASYTNGPVTATRVDDALAGGGPGDNLHLVFGAPGGSTTDQLWVDGIASVRAEARFAGYSQRFGYDDDDDGVGDVDYVNLFNVTGSQYAVLGSASHQFSMGVSWNWARSAQGPGQGGTFYSQESRNNNEDHMVTYRITGLTDPGEAVWMLFWEDLRGPYGCGSDRDFNDLAVEIRASPVPLPGADILAMIGFAGVSVLRYRRKA